MRAVDLDPERRVWRTARTTSSGAVHLSAECQRLARSEPIEVASGLLHDDRPVCSHCTDGAARAAPGRREPEVTAVPPDATVYASSSEYPVAHLSPLCHRLPDEPVELRRGEMQGRTALCKYCTGERARPPSARLVMEARR